VSAALIAAIVVVVLIVLLVVLMRAMWKVSEPNEAMIITGFGARGVEGAAASMGFRIIVGKGAFVIPGLQTVRRLDLSVSKVPLSEDCVTNQGIPVVVRGVVLFKVGDDMASIANASRRFLGQSAAGVSESVKEVFAGHLRSIIGGMTVEQIIHERDALARQTREASSDEMQKLGLVIDSLQISQLDDPTGYIENLAKPHAARVEAEARIAAAQRQQEAEAREAEAAAQIAAARSTSQIQQAEAQANADKAKAIADMAGPQAAANARQAVIEQETRVAELEALKAERRLEAEVRKPADAKAYEQRVAAEAERDASISRAEAQARQVRLAAEANAERVKVEAEANASATRQTGEAEAAAVKAKGMAAAEASKAQSLAEAAGIEARASALAANQDAVIQQQVAEKLPEIVKALSSMYSGVDNLTVLNGAEGMQQGILSMVGTAGALLPQLRQMLGQGSVEAPKTNGSVPAAPARPAAE
jgi:flotillin